MILTENRLTFDNSHFIENYQEFVCPQNFRNLADWIYGWSNYMFEEKITIGNPNGEHIAACLPSGSIIYVKTDYLHNFFRQIYPSMTNKFVLITGQGDGSTPGRFLSYLDHNDSKIIHWFGQNADIDSSQTNKFTPVPIGKKLRNFSEKKKRVWSVAKLIDVFVILINKVFVRTLNTQVMDVL
jgi:hypothetical protein